MDPEKQMNIKQEKVQLGEDESVVKTVETKRRALRQTPERAERWRTSPEPGRRRNRSRGGKEKTRRLKHRSRSADTPTDRRDDKSEYARRRALRQTSERSRMSSESGRRQSRSRSRKEKMWRLKHRSRSPGTPTDRRDDEYNNYEYTYPHIIDRRRNDCFWMWLAIFLALLITLILTFPQTVGLRRDLVNLCDSVRHVMQR